MRISRVIISQQRLTQLAKIGQAIVYSGLVNGKSRAQQSGVDLVGHCLI